MEELRLPDKPIESRSVQIITAEIKTLCRQAQSVALLYAVEIGCRLQEAKEALPHGEWGNWLKNEVEFSQSTANNFMQLYKEYGWLLLSKEGVDPNSQSIGNLSYSKALQLLAIPREERESFAQEVGASELSVQQLKEAIEQRDQAQRAVEEAQEREKELADKLSAAEKEAAAVGAKAEEISSLRKKLDSLTKKYEKEVKGASKLQEELKKAKENPEVPAKTVQKLREEIEKTVKDELKTGASEELGQVKEQLLQAEKELEQLKISEEQSRTELEKIQKKAKISDPNVMEFKLLFDSVQGTVKKMKSVLEKLRESDPETADKFAGALKSFGATLG